MFIWTVSVTVSVFMAPKRYGAQTIRTGTVRLGCEKPKDKDTRILSNRKSDEKGCGVVKFYTKIDRQNSCNTA